MTETQHLIPRDRLDAFRASLDAARGVESLHERYRLEADAREVLEQIELSIVDEIDASGYTGVQRERRHWWLVGEFDTWINDDGFFSIFCHFDEDGDDGRLREIPDAHRTLGFDTGAAIFESAVAKLPDAPPFPDLDARRAFLEPLWEVGDPLFDELENEYNTAYPEMIQERYILDHPDLFFDK